MKNCTVVFEPAKKAVEVASGTTLIEAARKAGVFIDAPCGGKGHCGKCRIKIVNGKHDFENSPLLSESQLKAGIRLACLTRVKGDMVVEVPEIDVVNDIMVEDMSSGSAGASRAARVLEVLKKSGLRVENGFKTVRLEVKKPTIDDNIPDWERVMRELKLIVRSEKISCPLDVLKKLPTALREADFNITLTLHRDEHGYQVLNIGGKKEDKIYGLCVDIGTTTVAACLVNLATGGIEASASSGNLQMQYGGDVISRIIYSTKPGGLEKLRRAVVGGTINRLIEEMRQKLGIEKEQIVCSVFAGNTTMSHLFLGVPAEYIRLEPYIPAFRNAPPLKAGDVFLDINPHSPVYMLPNVASYVGGDIVSGVLAAGFWDLDKNTLFLDLGTNGEIVLGNREWMVACACSAGPAFEGGEISCGMRASTGAIDEVKIDRVSLQPEFRVIGNVEPKGICGSGIIDLIAELFLSGIIDRKGKFKKNVKSTRIRHNPSTGCHEYVLAWGRDSADGRDITINEIDIDNFLRAKGAVYSGCRTLLSSVGLDMEDIDRIIIAGGIGQNLDINNSIIIGLLPDIDPARFEFIGNSSLTGAYACVISDDARKKACEIADQITYIELSADPAYMEEFVGACFIPHTDIKLFPSVSAVMNL
jgi:uncharacterized 2Fe-2S/4Fe-4S cluster protein (DUF4445 family)